ncbi:hypothetical protein BGZ95_009059, partial [Linnemannia exigua]
SWPSSTIRLLSRATIRLASSSRSFAPTNPTRPPRLTWTFRQLLLISAHSPVTRT